MTDIIFLDFDGVTHPRVSGATPGVRGGVYFSYLANILASVDKVAPGAAFVISSSWRSWPSFNTFVPRELLTRVVGVTPVINRQADGNREDEAMAWLFRNSDCFSTPIRWMAIDDVPHLWRSSSKVLVCDDGFKAAEIAAFEQGYENTMNADAAVVSGIII